MDRRQIICVVALIKNSEGEILLAQRNEPNNPKIHGKWEFVGGGLEYGEDPEMAVIREVKEEAGLDVKVTKLFPKILFSTSNSVSGDGYHIVIITYECEIIGGELKPQDSEIIQLKYVKPEDVHLYDSFKNVQETVEILLKSYTQ